MASTHPQSQTRSHNGQSDGTLNAVKSELSDLNETLASSARDVVDQGKRTVQVAGSAARKAATRVSDSATEATDRLGELIAERPIASVAIAAGAGAVLMGLVMMWRRR